jgi:nucleotide-binding universal stress UspA family protein
MSEPKAVRFRSIMAAIDFSPASDRALSWAAALAAQRGAELRLVHTIAWAEPTDVLVALQGPAEEELLAGARARLAELAQSLRGRLRSVVCDVVIGAPATVLLDEARKHQPELLVLGTRGLRGWRHILLGSTAQRVIGAAGCPVLAVHAEDATPPDRPWRLLAASDGSPDAMLAVREAVRQLAPAEVVLLRAFEAPLFYGGVGEAPAFTIVEAARASAEEQVRQEARQLSVEGITALPLLRDGFPPEVITTAVTELQADVVVLGSRGRGGMAHLLLGSTAERVAQRASAPVMVVPRRAAALVERAAEAVAIVGAPGDEQC